MLHRQKRGQEDNKAAEESKTADEATVGDRCPLSKNLDNDLRAISTQAGLSKCELLEKVAGEYIEHKKEESDCLTGTIAATDERCRYVKRP
jgi:hypothetical protein